MSDSGSNPGVLEVLGDIAKDVGKATGDTLSTGMKTAFGTGSPSVSQTPASSNRKTPGEVRQIEFARARLKQIAADQNAVRQQNQQREMQRLQTQTTSSAPVQEQIVQPGAQIGGQISNDIAENMAELRGGRKGG